MRIYKKRIGAENISCMHCSNKQSYLNRSCRSSTENSIQIYSDCSLSIVSNIIQASNWDEFLKEQVKNKNKTYLVKL